MQPKENDAGGTYKRIKSRTSESIVEQVNPDAAWLDCLICSLHKKPLINHA